VNQTSAGESARTVVRLRCPRCKRQGVLEPLAAPDVYVEEWFENRSIVGARRCPNPDCHALVLFRMEVDDGGGHGKLVSYPPERLDFDATNLPDGVLSSLTEAITCHASQCFRASAMMVRRTLEELCADQGRKVTT
jgi:hypothetical protein